MEKPALSYHTMTAQHVEREGFFVRIKFTYKNYKYSYRATVLSWIANCFFAVTSLISGVFCLGFLLGTYDLITKGSWDSFFWGIIASLIGFGYIALFIKIIFPAIDRIALRDKRDVIGEVQPTYDRMAMSDKRNVIGNAQPTYTISERSIKQHYINQTKSKR